MSTLNKEEERNKIIRGLELTYQKLLAFKKRMGSSLVISKNGEILKISVEEYMSHYANDINSKSQNESSKNK
jgi:hypothetical protein